MIKHDSSNDAEISVILAWNLVYLLSLSLVLQPFMPSTSNEICQQLDIQRPVYALETTFRWYRLRFSGQKK